MTGESSGQIGRYRLGTHGLTTHGFASINRTIRFYEQALAAAFDLVPLGAEDKVENLDGVLSFGGSRWWRERPRPDCPLIFAIHGGAVVNPEVHEWVDHLTIADAFLINCPSDETVMRAMFGDRAPRFGLIDLPASPSFQPLNTQEARQILGLEHKHLIGFVSRLLPQKNAHVFLRLLAAVRRRLVDHDVHGLIIGDYWLDYPLLNYVGDTYPDYLDGLARSLGVNEVLAFAPASLDDAELSVAYSALDVLVHPTNAIDENFGYTPVEAMACGTPVVAAAYGGLKSTLLDGVTGALVDTWPTDGGIRLDFDSLVDETVELLRDPTRRAVVSVAAVRHGAERFDWTDCSRRLVDEVHRAIEAWKASPEPVVVAPAQIRVGSDPVLPPNEGRPWDFFRPRVEAFTSRAALRCPDVYRVRAAAPIERVDTCWRLEDPTWPATYTLSEEAAELLLDTSNTSISIESAIARLSEAEIDRLLLLGALIGSPRS